MAKPLKRLKNEAKKYRRVLGVVDSGIAHLEVRARRSQGAPPGRVKLLICVNGIDTLMGARSGDCRNRPARSYRVSSLGIVDREAERGSPLTALTFMSGLKN
jgi:hypothetical protein